MMAGQGHHSLYLAVTRFSPRTCNWSIQQGLRGPRRGTYGADADFRGPTRNHH